MQRDNKITLLAAIFISLISLMIIMSSLNEAAIKPGTAKVYLVQDSYRGVIDHGFFSFSFVVENNVDKNTSFEIEYLLEDIVIGEETITVQPRTKTEFARQVPSRFRDPILPVKFIIALSSDTQTDYELSYWIFGLDYE